MKKLVLLFIFFSIKVSFAQNQLLAGRNMGVNDALTSTNGQYKFLCNKDNNNIYRWQIVSTQTNDILFSTNGKKVGTDLDLLYMDPNPDLMVPRLYFTRAYEAYIQPSGITNFVPGDQYPIFPIQFLTGYLPLLVFADIPSYNNPLCCNPNEDLYKNFIEPVFNGYYIKEDEKSMYPNNELDFIGLPSAQSTRSRQVNYVGRTAFNKSVFNHAKEPTNNEVFEKLPNGNYSVPDVKKATALKLLDDGNLIIVNNTNQILWESATAQQIINKYTYHKEFKDIRATFTGGLGLVSPGNINFINSTIYQDKGNIVMIANNIVDLTHNGGVTDLSIYEASTGYIDLKCVPIKITPKVSKKYVPRTIAKIDSSQKEEIVSKTTVLAYPNPTKGQLKFDVSDKTEKIIYITISDINGKIIARYADTSEADISAFSVGSYFYKIDTTNNTYLGQILKN